LTLLMLLLLLLLLLLPQEREPWHDEVAAQGVNGRASFEQGRTVVEHLGL
jgi:hypothetical protein